MYNRAVLARWKEFDVMPSLEERVAYLEGRFGEHTQTTNGIRDDVSHLRDEMLRLFEDVDRRFEHVDKRFEQVDQRFEAVDRRFEAVDRRFDRTDDRLESIDAKIDRHFTWLVGIQMAGFLAVFGALVSQYFK
jgi:chromosome segregation ATPase